MDANHIIRLIYERLEARGWKGRIVPLVHLKELQQEFERHHKNGWLDEELITAYLSRFDFSLLDDFHETHALIVVTAPQPQARVTFQWKDRLYSCIIPPTYSHATDQQINACLEEIMQPRGFQLEKKRLPEKLLAVRSGLARYGKNNIAYVSGMGSFHRPVVFVTDMPCSEDTWGESKSLKACSTCSACLEACPTGAIAADRFLLHAERCITFHNERSPDFPDWLNPSWHNCLIGCMFCQNACPLNAKVSNWIENEMTFSEAETAYFLQGVSIDKIQKKTLNKLETLGMMAYVQVLGRNVRALIENKKN